MTDIPLYEISQLSFSYDRKPALRCAGLALCPGQATAFVGANGSGKTTLLKLLNGLIGPYSGSVRFLGRELAESRELRSRSIYLHQHPVMFTGTVRDNIAYPLSIRRAERKGALARAEALAESMCLGPLLLRQANRLSGGETQRVALARAIITGADILLLDEPSSSMDASSVDALRDILLDLKSRGMTLLFSAHDTELVSAIADRILVFEGGTVKEAP